MHNIIFTMTYNRSKVGGLYDLVFAVRQGFVRRAVRVICCQTGKYVRDWQNAMQLAVANVCCTDCCKVHRYTYSHISYQTDLYSVKEIGEDTTVYIERLLLARLVLACSHRRHGQDKTVSSCLCRRCEQAIIV